MKALELAWKSSAEICQKREEGFLGVIKTYGETPINNPELTEIYPSPRSRSSVVKRLKERGIIEVQTNKTLPSVLIYIGEGK